MQFLCDYVSSGRTGKQVSPPSTKGPLFSCHCIWIIQKPWCFKRECLPQAQVFEHLAPGWLCCVGTLWNFKRQSLVGERALVPPVFEFIAWPCYQFTFFFFLLESSISFLLLQPQAKTNSSFHTNFLSYIFSDSNAKSNTETYAIRS